VQSLHDDRRAAAGIAIVNGKLSCVVMSPTEEMWVVDVTIGEAAKIMRACIRTEIDLGLDVETTDERYSEFMRMIEATGA